MFSTCKYQLTNDNAFTQSTELKSMKTEPLPGKATKLSTHSPINIKYLLPQATISHHSVIFSIRSTIGRIPEPPFPGKMSVIHFLKNPLFIYPSTAVFLPLIHHRSFRLHTDKFTYNYCPNGLSRSRTLKRRFFCKNSDSLVAKIISNWQLWTIMYVSESFYVIWSAYLPSNKIGNVLYRNTMARSRNFYTSSAILIAWSEHFGVDETSCLWRKSNPDLSAF